MPSRTGQGQTQYFQDCPGHSRTVGNYAVPIIPSLPAAGCPRPPVPMDGSIIPFPATNEGAEIVYHCDPGFQPQSDVTAMCASNGLWTPDPALLQCVG